MHRGMRTSTDERLELTREKIPSSVFSGTYAPVCFCDVQEEMRQFVVAIALLHPDLDFLCPDDRSLYADTVLGILFYKFR